MPRYAHVRCNALRFLHPTCLHFNPDTINFPSNTVSNILPAIRIFGFVFPLSISPHPPPSSAGWSGDVGEDCLSTQCEFRSRLTRRATQGTSKRWRIGDRLLLVTFLGEARKVTSCRAAPGEVGLFLEIHGSTSSPRTVR